MCQGDTNAWGTTMNATVFVLKVYSVVGHRHLTDNFQVMWKEYEDGGLHRE